MMDNAELEWLETDGLGGFATGALSLIPSRRYHSLLTTSVSPPVNRYILLNSIDVRVETSEGSFPLSGFQYMPDVVAPFDKIDGQWIDGALFPSWKYSFKEYEIIFSLFMPFGENRICLSWELTRTGKQPVSLSVRPLVSGRDYHSLHHRNGAMRGFADVSDNLINWMLYEDLPQLSAFTNGSYQHIPVWYHNFLYSSERERGFNYIEDLFSPGILKFSLDKRKAVAIFSSSTAAPFLHTTPAESVYDSLAKKESIRRNSFSSPYERAATSYVVKRGDKKTIIAGYPWFADWGRDTFISVRGLCIATGELKEAKSVLLNWSSHLKEGLMPNCFPDHDGEASYNAADAPLWFVIAAYELVCACDKANDFLSDHEKQKLINTSLSIVKRYASKTQSEIAIDKDFLVYAGNRDTQLTWMDAKVDGWPVTPRGGKPVEINALWVNALIIAASYDKVWKPSAEMAKKNFKQRFWNSKENCLFDVIDVNRAHGTGDPRIRPNQIFAVGGLPFELMPKDKAKKIVEVVENLLVTEGGLRTLSPIEREYLGKYEGRGPERDSAYHQGTAWPWLMGPFVEAWVRVKGSTKKAKIDARKAFIEPMLKNLDPKELGHLPEISDGEPPHRPNGCPFQAWSLGELLRVEKVVLGISSKKTPTKKQTQKKTVLRKQAI